MTFTKKNIKIEEQILEDFMSLLDSGNLDKTWKKEWTATEQAGHTNFLTNHKYSGANPIILEMYMALRGHHLPLWIGFAQAKKDLNCVPRKGSKAAKILRPNPIKIDLKNEDGSPKLDKDGNQEFYMKLTFKGTSVFNISDLVGLDEKAQSKLDNIISSFKSDCEKNVRPLDERVKAAHDRLMIFTKDLKNGLKHGGDQSYYNSSEDFVKMPERSTFVDDQAYLSTLSHEFCHASGHKDRLNRKWLNEYSKFRPQEEICVEFAAVLICNRLQISCNTQNHAAYISSWAKHIRSAKSPATELMKVFSNSVKAADLVIGEE